MKRLSDVQIMTMLIWLIVSHGVAAAAPQVKIKVLAASPVEMTLQARADTPGCAFAWQLAGPGELQGNLDSATVLYVLPTDAAAPARQADITVTATDKAGHTASAQKTIALPQISCWENDTPGATCTEDSTGMAFVYVPGDCFMMGSPEDEKDRGSDEEQHRVCVHEGDGFWMGKYEVTQAQWQAVMKNNPSYFEGADRPVEQVSWDDAQAFLQKLNATVETHGRASLQFRLPSEAEWEYAARAGTITPFSFGETISPDQANYDGNYTYGNGKKGVYRQQTTDVGSFPNNAFGLYDMHGNVWEWCQDTYASYRETPTDGSAHSGGSKRVLRGGSWSNAPGDVRSAFRFNDDPAFRSGLIGFRLLRTK